MGDILEELEKEAEGRFFRDVVLMDPSHLLAVASNGLGDDQFDVDVWQSIGTMARAGGRDAPGRVSCAPHDGFRVRPGMTLSAVVPAQAGIF